MLHSKEASLRQLISSKNGVHLTSYLKNCDELQGLKHQIRKTIALANDQLKEVMSADELQKFLDPISKLLSNNHVLKNFSSSVGLFRTKNAFIILNIPIQLEHLCVIADSFHVKPLLKWSQVDQEFLVLGIAKNYASLYIGNQQNFRIVDNFHFSINPSEQVVDEILEWINEWLHIVKSPARPMLFIAGDKNISIELSKKIMYSKSHLIEIDGAFTNELASLVVSDARNVMNDEVHNQWKKLLLEYCFAESMKLTKKNIFEIAKAAAKGRIEKLIVADDVQVFGKMDKKTGGIILNPKDLDHEDDDLLDDIAQEVIGRGGKVVIAKKDQIPKGRPLVAILKDEYSDNDLWRAFSS